MEKQKDLAGSNVPLSSEVVPEAPRRRNRIFFLISSVSTLVLIILVASYYNFKWIEQQVSDTGRQAGDTQQDNQGGGQAYVLSAQFANWEDVPVEINPQVPEYSVSKDLSNVTNAGQFQFSDDAKTLLAKNAFVVIPSDRQEFYPIYESNRYGQVPSFITTDSMLHSYHLMFDNQLKKLEEDKLIPELKQLNEAMLTSSVEQYNSLKGTEWENAAKRNVGFFSVGYRLLGGEQAAGSGAEMPILQAAEGIVKGEVDQEIALIESHAGIDKSPVMNMGTDNQDKLDTPQGSLSPEDVNEDYSQYVPRGHYTKSDDLKKYFKAMMWYGRLNFRLKNQDEVRSSLLISSALASNSNAQKTWGSVYEPINFFVGKSDDITYYQMRDAMKEIFGDDLALATVTKDKDKLTAFIAKAKTMEAPQINSMPIFNAAIQPDRTEAIQGFRFLGQRFTIDASIFQRLIVREVGEKGQSCSEAPFAKGRFLPKGLDVPAAMGSEEAYDILKSMGDTDYACYDENMGKMKTYIAGLDKNVWTQNLYWGWLYSLKPLTEKKSTGYPSFMTNEAWQRKSLNTYLGSWTELKRDTILYSKQAYAEMGGGGEEIDHRGYVEPEPYTYARLASLIKMTAAGLDSRGLLDEDSKDTFNKLQELATTLKTISEKELNNVALTDEEYGFIEEYGGNIEHIWYDAFKKADGGAPELDKDSNSPVVADVATDPNGWVLEEGTGYVSEIYAVVPVDGKLRIARGAAYSYYEFTQSIDNRLSDDTWEELLNSSSAPALPEWTKAFTASKPS